MITIPRPKRVEVRVPGCALRRYELAHDVRVDHLPVRYGMLAEWQVWEQRRVQDRGDRVFASWHLVSRHRKRKACFVRAEKLLRAIERGWRR